VSVKGQQYKVKKCILYLDFTKKVIKYKKHILSQSQANYFEINIFKKLCLLLKIIELA
jgi:hypothetical protein